MARSCVVIGSGLGGLSCALMLARAGFEVTVLEQDSKPGGCLQCFVRSGVKFETGMHFVGSADEGQTLDRLLRRLGVRQYLQLDRLDPLGYDTIRISGMGEFKFANGREAFVETLSCHFPGQADNLARYHDVVSRLAGAWSIETMHHAVDDLSIDTSYHSMSVNAVIDGLIDDEDLRKVLVANMPLYAGERDRTPFALHAFITDFYNQSAWRIVGGSDTLAAGMCQELARLGGRIRTSARVTRVVCDSTRATGVEVNGSEFVGADYIIATQHPATLVPLVDSRLLRPAFRQRIDAISDTVGCFTVYARFRPGTIPYAATNHYCYSTPQVWGTERYTAEQWPLSYMYMHTCAAAGQRYADGAIIIAYMRWDEVERWADTCVGKRGEEYERFKDERARRLIDAVERDMPGTGAAIVDYWTSTPLTYRDYTGTRHGAMYGMAKNVYAGVGGRVQYRLKVPNLLLAGQSINSHGILGTLVGSTVTASAII